MKSSSREQSVQEQRKFPRVSANCTLSYRRVDGDPGFRRMAESNDAILENISGGGIAFASSERLEVGTMLALEVALPELPTSVISMGRVVWSVVSKDGGWDHGVEFYWIGWKDESAQNQIRGFIADALKSGR